MGLSLCSSNSHIKYVLPEILSYSSLMDIDGWEDKSDSRLMIRSAPMSPVAHSQRLPNSSSNIDSGPQASNRKLSLIQKIELRNTNIDQFKCGEREAKLYMDKVEEDTLAHVESALRVVSSVVEKAEYVNEGIVNEGDNIRQSCYNVCLAMQDIDETNSSLQGMNSLSGEVANVLWRKKPKARKFSRIMRGNMDSAPRSTILRCQSARSNKCRPVLTGASSEGTKQQKISRGICQLNSAMDTIKSRTMNIAEELQRQDRQLTDFSEDISRTQYEMKTQTTLIRRIRRK